MPVLPARTTKKINLSRFPADDPAWVEVYTDNTVAEVEQVAEMMQDDATNSVKRHILLLLSSIKAWNLTDESGSPLEVNLDNVRRLNETDLNDILEGLSAEEGKPALTTEKKSA